MALYDILTGRTKQELLDQLNGLIVGKVNLQDGADVNGLALIFAAPAAITVTFTDPDTVTLAQIVDEINTAAGLAGVASIKTVKTGSGGDGRQPVLDRRLSLVDPAGSGVTITLAGSTAAAALGIDASNIVGAVVDPTKVISGGDHISGHYYVIISP